MWPNRRISLLWWNSIKVSRTYSQHRKLPGCSVAECHQTAWVIEVTYGPNITHKIEYWTELKSVLLLQLAFNKPLHMQQNCIAVRNIWLYQKNQRTCCPRYGSTIYNQNNFTQSVCIIWYGYNLRTSTYVPIFHWITFDIWLKDPHLI